jgi:hypothetical protein
MVGRTFEGNVFLLEKIIVEEKSVLYSLLTQEKKAKIKTYVRANEKSVFFICFLALFLNKLMSNAPTLYKKLGVH